MTFRYKDLKVVKYNSIVYQAYLNWIKLWRESVLILYYYVILIKHL